MIEENIQPSRGITLDILLVPAKREIFFGDFYLEANPVLFFQNLSRRLEWHPLIFDILSVILPKITQEGKGIVFELCGALKFLCFRIICTLQRVRDNKKFSLNIMKTDTNFTTLYILFFAKLFSWTHVYKKRKNMAPIINEVNPCFEELAVMYIHQ